MYLRFLLVVFTLLSGFGPAYSQGVSTGAPYVIDVAMDKYPNATVWNKFGYNLDVDTGGNEVIASWGGTFTPPTTAETLKLVSTSAADSVTSTGARGIVVYGVDENRVNQIEVVNLAGTDTVATTSEWLGINRVAVYVAGTALENVGTINLYTATGIQLAQMPAGQGTTQQAIFYTKDDHTFLPEWLYLNINKIAQGGSPRVTIYGYVFSAVSNAKYEVYRSTFDTAVENTIMLSIPVPFVVGENSVLWFEANTNVDNTVVNIRFSGNEKQNY